MQVNMRFSLGFFKPSSTFDFGSSIRAFGIPGAGGAFAYADPDAQIGFAYAPNKMGFHPWNDPREKALREALDRSLKKMGGSPVPFWMYRGGEWPESLTILRNRCLSTYIVIHHGQ